MNNFDRAQRLRVIKLLKELGRKNFKLPSQYSPRGGICYIVAQETGNSLNEIFPNYETIASGWRYYSGSALFPIPPTKDKRYNPEAATATFAFTRSCWVGQYGNMRRMFARYLAREFRKEFK